MSLVRPSVVIVETERRLIMAKQSVDEVVVKVPQGTKTVKIEFGNPASNENVSGKGGRKKICD